MQTPGIRANTIASLARSSQPDSLHDPQPQSVAPRIGQGLHLLTAVELDGREETPLALLAALHRPDTLRRRGVAVLLEAAATPAQGAVLVTVSGGGGGGNGGGQACRLFRFCGGGHLCVSARHRCMLTPAERRSRAPAHHVFRCSRATSSGPTDSPISNADFGPAPSNPLNSPSSKAAEASNQMAVLIPSIRGH